MSSIFSEQERNTLLSLNSIEDVLSLDSVDTYKLLEDIIFRVSDIRERSMKEALLHIEPLAWNLPDKVPLPTDPTEITYLKHYDMSNVSDQQAESAKLVRGLLPNITAIKGMARFRNVLWAVVLSCHSDNVFLRYLKYYFDSLNVDEPFVESSRSTISENNTDWILCPVIFGILCNAAIRIENGRYARHDSRAAYIQLVLWICQSPYDNVLSFKSFSGVMAQFFLSSARRGTSVNWSGDFLKVSKPEFGKLGARDTAFLDANSDAVEEQLIWLKNVGLDKLVVVYEELIFGTTFDSKVEEAADWFASHLSLLMVRGNEKQIFRNSMAELSEKAINPNKGSAKYMRELGIDFGHYLLGNNSAAGKGKGDVLLTTLEKFYSKVPSLLTSRSAGIGLVKRVKVTSSKRGRGMQYKFEEGRSDREDRSQVELAIRSKIAAFLIEPYQVTFSSKVNKKGELNLEWIREIGSFTRAISIAKREVTGRGVRPIHMRPLHEFIFHAYVVVHLYNYLIKFNQDRSVPGFTFSNQYSTFPNIIASFAKDTGNPIFDHSTSLRATSDKAGILNALLDYSSFDASQDEFHYIPFAEGASLVLENANINFPEQLGSISDYFNLTFVHAMINHFKIGGEPTEEVHMLPSGLFGTAAYNTLVNIANTMHLLNIVRRDEFKSLQDKINFRDSFHKILGDDKSSHFPITQRLDSDDVNLLLDLMVTAAAEDGLTLNRVKTSISTDYAEYLQKIVIKGRHFAKHVMQPIFRENFIDTANVIERARINRTWLSSYTGRGGRVDWCFRFQVILFALTRRITGVTRTSRSGNDRVMFNLPIATLFVPNKSHGIGLFRGEGSNDDVPLVVWLKSNEYALNLCNSAAGISQFLFDASAEKDVARSALKSDMFKPGMDFIASHLDKGVVQKSIQAQKRLQKQGIKLGDMTYANWNKQLLMKSVKARDFAVLYKLPMGRIVTNMIRASAMDVGYEILNDFPELKHMTFIYGDELPDIYPVSPVAGIAGSWKEKIMKFGITADVSRIKLTLDAILRADPTMPATFTSDMILSKINSLNSASLKIISDVLIGMGMSDAGATSAAALIATNYTEYEKLLQSVSYTGGVNFLAVKEGTHFEIRNVNEKVSAIARIYGSIVSIRQKSGSIRYVTVDIDGEGVDSINNRIISSVTELPKLYSIVE